MDTMTDDGTPNQILQYKLKERRDPIV